VCGALDTYVLCPEQNSTCIVSVMLTAWNLQADSSPDYVALAMTPMAANNSRIRIAVPDGDPLRLAGLRTLFDTESDLEFLAVCISELPALGSADVVLLHGRNDQNLFNTMADLKAARPDLKIIVTRSGADGEMILKALAAGAKGYVDEAAAPNELVQAIRMVHQGSVWAPRWVLSIFIERVTSSGIFSAGLNLTNREKEVLALLVAAQSNKEIGSVLGITERTVKAYVTQLLRKLGVQSRVELSVHAIRHGLVSAK
jgi:DNA-binding NarL/FixJ family response regulator